MRKEEIIKEDESYRYQLLARLQQDCEYYLGNGNRYDKHLWAENAKEQIEYMKILYDSFDDDKKPEWITMNDIMEYEEKMLDENYDRELCKKEMEDLIETYGDEAVFYLDPLYERFGVDIVNAVRSEMRGRIVGL